MIFITMLSPRKGHLDRKGVGRGGRIVNAKISLPVLDRKGVGRGGGGRIVNAKISLPVLNTNSQNIPTFLFIFLSPHTLKLFHP